MSKRTVAAAAAVLAVAVGSGVAIAAANGDSLSPSSFFADVAKHLGISPQKLQDATKAAAIDQVDAALKAGRITQEQADALKARIESGDFPPFLGGPRLGEGPFGGPGHFGFGLRPGELRAGGLSAAASYLGLPLDQLFAKLRAGQSLADVAKAQGKTVDGLEQALLDNAKTHLDQLVSQGALTQSQASAILDGLKAHIDDLVNGTFRDHFDRGPFGHFGGAPVVPPSTGASPSFAPSQTGVDL